MIDPKQIAQLALQAAAEAIQKATTALAITYVQTDTSGQTDVTGEIQSCLDRGGHIQIPKGTYLIDPERSLRIRSYTRLELHPEAVFLLKPNASERNYGFLLEDVEDVEITGGRIQGDRMAHKYDERTHEWGMGIAVYASSRVLLRDMEIMQCTGDGVVVGRGSEDVMLAMVNSHHNRRQGLTIGRVIKMRVRDCQFDFTGDFEGNPGTKPMAGIDIEPDTSGSMLCEDIEIENTQCANNQGNGIESNAVAKEIDGETKIPLVRDIRIRNCILRANAWGAHLQRLHGVVFEGNKVLDNRWHGCRLLNATSTTSPIKNNVFGNNYIEKLAPLVRQPAKSLAGFVESRDLKKETSAGSCEAETNIYQ